MVLRKSYSSTYDCICHVDFGFIVAGHVMRACHCLITLPVVVFICVFHLSDGAKLIPKYVYGSCWLRAGISWFL